MRLVPNRSIPRRECHKLAPENPKDWDGKSLISLLLRAWKENNTSRERAASVLRHRLSGHLGKPPYPEVPRTTDRGVKGFNPAKFQWFRDEFIHRGKINAVYQYESLPRLFGGFSTEGR
jgi:hypothetical protein